MTAITDSVVTRISRAAKRLAYAGVSTDDFVQVAALKVVETEQKRPDLAQQTEAYIAQGGIWAARNYVKTEELYSRHVVSMSIEAGDDDRRFTDIEAGELGPEEQAIQDEVIKAITKALEGLTPETTTIVKMLYLGYGEAEIARTLNISKSSVTQKKTKLKNVLKRIL